MCSPSSSPYGRECGVDLRAEGPRVALPVKARRAKARERLLSYREPASRNPQTMHRKTCRRSCTRAPFRLLPIRALRQAGLRTSSWLAPSRITNRSCDLPVEKTRDASDRYLPPKRTACTRTSRVPSSCRNFRCADTPRRLRLRMVILGDRTFTASEDRFGGSALDASLMPAGLRLFRVMSVGVFFPRRRCRPNL